MSTIGTISGGAGSWAACRLWVDQHGTDGLSLIFTDVLGEDEDTLRFVTDAGTDLGLPVNRICDGRTIWDVFEQKRWLGNSRLAHCSWELKTKPAADWIAANVPDATKIIVGIDASETHRLPAMREKWAPLEVLAPLADKGWWKPKAIHWARERGLKVPRMYQLGFGHANCPGCVKAGKGHWARLLEVWPDRYAEAEKHEQEMRDQLGDVSILPGYTLTEWRERVEARRIDQLDLFDVGGCACF